MSTQRESYPAQVRGPITAKQAFALAERELKRRNTAAFRFSFISAGEYIDYRGYSVRWELFFELPESAELVMFTLEPQGSAWEDAQPELHVVIERRQRAAEKSKPSLPLRFRDSPEAVAALAEQGADWVSGDTHLTLSTKFAKTGEPVWHTETTGRVLETDFAE